MDPNIKTLTVHLHQTTPQKVGTLATKDRNIYFEYDADFLKTGIELSPYKLPLKPGVHRCDDSPFDGLWGLFADSLPDGWGRLLMDRHLTRLGVNPNALTPLDRLAYVGRHAMGALSYEPEVEMERDPGDIVLDELAAHSARILEGNSDAMVDELLVLGGSSAGARPKVQVQLSDDGKRIIHGQQKLKEGYAHYMVKFASSMDSRETGLIEYAYGRMATDAGLEMPQTTLLHGRERSYFATRRFDRMGERRVHMHSVAGLVHSDFRLPSLDYDDLLSLTLHLTRDVNEQRKMYRLACFNLLAHNRDDHTKNFSYLMDEKGRWRVSPVYDVTFSYGPGGEHSTTYLGEGKMPTREHLTKLGEKHRIKDHADIIAQVHDAVNRWDSIAKETGISAKTRKEIGRILEQDI